MANILRALRKLDTEWWSIKRKTKVWVKRAIAYYCKRRYFYASSYGVVEVGIYGLMFDNNLIEYVSRDRNGRLNTWCSGMGDVFETRESALHHLKLWYPDMRHMQNFGGDDLKEYREKMNKIWIDNDNLSKARIDDASKEIREFVGGECDV